MEFLQRQQAIDIVREIWIITTTTACRYTDRARGLMNPDLMLSSYRFQSKGYNKLINTLAKKKQNICRRVHTFLRQVNIVSYHVIMNPGTKIKWTATIHVWGN